MQKEETRRIILAAAYSLFGVKGYDKTTMRELARRADVGLGTIFKHFPDKPSLLISAFNEDITAVLQNSLDTLPSSDIRLQLTHLVRELYEFFGLNPSFSRTLIKEILFLGDNQEPVLKDHGSAFLGKIEKLFLAAIERGELDSATDCLNGALAFFSFFLLGLIGGLQQARFDAAKQTLFFDAMLNAHLAKT